MTADGDGCRWILLSDGRQAIDPAGRHHSCGRLRVSKKDSIPS
jgi:hypothetical protein